ncbi:MAG: hypothetical protein RIT27_1149 [Pseudomonadota bacterium]|jgi:mono/diheme cytochrome c family protein
MKARFKMHVSMLSVAIASIVAASSPVWADSNERPETTSSRPTNDARPPEQRSREQEKDKDDARTVPQTKPAVAGAGYVQTDKTVHYPGDKFSLKAVVPKSLKDVWAGKAVVKIVITMPGDLGAVVVDVPTPAADQNTQGDNPRQVAALPPDVMATLPAGDYQMAMIVTKLGGNPLNLNDWYGGFRAMLGVKRVKVSATNSDAEDPNGTGQVAGDGDGDGYPDSDANMPPPPPPTGGTTTPPTGGTTTPPTGGTTIPPTGGTTTPPTGGTTTAAGKTAFDSNCAGCHTSPARIAAASNATAIRSAINSNRGGMGSLSLTDQQLNEIAAYVKGSTTATAPTTGGTTTPPTGDATDFANNG